LSYDEKKALIENIHRLDGDQMTAVVDIIQSAMPSTDCGGDGDEVEIPMDELDTYTLRQLQDYVHSIQQQTISIKRKRQSMSSSNSARTPRGKKAKNSTSVPVQESSSLSVLEPPYNPEVHPLSDINDAPLEEEFPVHGRKRSNSLDLFPSDEMEQDPIMTSDVSKKAFEEWTMPTNGGRDESDVSAISKDVAETWREAVSERKDTLHRESEMKAESEKMLERRIKVESERNDALQRAYEDQAIQISGERNRAADLLAQRESERSKRAEMSRTVEFDESHDALYQESLDL
jgi:hypothetical protein